MARPVRLKPFTFYEFFAGGGMARLGLGPKWACSFANDFDPKKAAAYRANFGDDALVLGDVAAVAPSDLPGAADLAWASFPCQDLSLAGAGAGLSGARSGTFWAFWRLIERLREDGRAPKIVVLENVVGLLTSHRGRDFASICVALDRGGYRFGAMVLDAARFLPQSRPRLFFVGVRDDVDVESGRVTAAPDRAIHRVALINAVETFDKALRDRWLWWRVALPERALQLADVLEDEPTGVVWHSPAQVKRLLSLMSDANLEKVRAAQRRRRPIVGGVYKRMRIEDGVKVQRAEVRFDGAAGCLRTPGGGSSRQTILVIEGGRIRSRLVSPRETARLMGLPESYKLPARANDAYHLTGDGVAVPVVRHLASALLEPLLRKSVGGALRAA